LIEEGKTEMNYLCMYYLFCMSFFFCFATVCARKMGRGVPVDSPGPTGTTAAILAAQAGHSNALLVRYSALICLFPLNVCTYGTIFTYEIHLIHFDLKLAYIVLQ
jgi:hypothetical protein